MPHTVLGAPPPRPPSKRGKPWIIVGILVTVAAGAFVMVLGLIPLVRAAVGNLTGPSTTIAPTNPGQSGSVSSGPGTDGPAGPARPSASSARPTATPFPQPATTAPPPPQPSAVTSLPSGSWITVFNSLEQDAYTESDAWAQARGLSGPVPVRVLNSSAIPGLNAGYWAIAATGSSSRTQASALCADFDRTLGGDCYPRQVG